jgi:hypothetical protein
VGADRGGQAPEEPAYLGEATIHRYERDRHTGQVIAREELAGGPRATSR